NSRPSIPLPGAATKKSSRWSSPEEVCRSMKPPAPGPVSGDSVTNDMSTAPTAASTALPPSLRIRAPASAVSGCPAATTPCMDAMLIGVAEDACSVPCSQGYGPKGGGKRMKRLVVVCCAGVVLLAVATGASAAIQIPQLPVQSPVKLPANVLPALDQATPAGQAPDTRRMRIGVTIAHPRAAAEDSYLKRLYNPSSANYHRFLTPSQYAKAFGVSKSTADAVRSWLAGGGLSIDYVSRARDYFLATGTVSEVEQLTRTQIGSYSFNGQTFLANKSAPQAPANLHVLQILGLNTYQRFHTAYSESHSVGHAPARLPAAAPNIGAQSPKDLWSIYEQPSNQTGKGVSVAILGNGATDGVVKDLHQFDKEN